MAAMHPGHGLPGQQDSSHSTTMAQAVGNQFVTQYYTVLHKQPHFLHRFYTDDSTMTYSEPGSTEALVFNSQKKIHEKVMSLGYQDAVTEIYSVDSQYSLNDGVIVQVTGSLRCTNRPKRSFTQTFFLAVQEKGYFVLNDLFRLLPEPVSPPQGLGEAAAAAAASAGPAPQENGYAAPPAGLHPPPIEHPPQLNGTAMPPPMSMPPPPAAPIPAPPQQQQPQQQQQPPPPQQQPEQPPPPPVQQQPPPQQQQQPEAPPPQAAEQASAKEPEAAAQPPAAQEEAAAPAEAEPAAEPAPEEPEAPAVPLTYAERLKQGAKAAPKPAPPRPAPKPAPAADAAPPAEGNGTEAPPPTTGGYGQEEAPGCSIFVKDLPADITVEKLAEVFAQFGPLVTNNRAVNLKSQKDKPSFAFIEFAQPASASAAITGPVTIDGQTVRVDEKKPLYLLRGPRGGRFEGGRGGGRFEGRGYYGRGAGGRGGPPMPGRGPGRGEYAGGRGGYPTDGGRGRGPRPDGGRGRGPPGRGPAGGGGRGGPRPQQPGAGAPAPTPTPEQPAAAGTA